MTASASNQSINRSIYLNQVKKPIYLDIQTDNNTDLITVSCFYNTWLWTVEHCNSASKTTASQLSLLPSARWKMSSSLWAMGWRPRVADWGGDVSVCCTAGPTVRYGAGNGWLHNVPPYHLIISSCQSAAASEIAKHYWSWVYSCKQRYSMYPDLYLYSTQHVLFDGLFK